MNVAVRYHSRGGNTKKVAEAIGKAVGIDVKDCSHRLDEPVDVLFLGCAVYGFGLDDTIKDYIAQLDPSKIKAVALFGTSAIVKTGNQEMAKLLKEKEIAVVREDFYCRGAFAMMHRDRPNDEDLKQAEVFARTVIKALE